MTLLWVKLLGFFGLKDGSSLIDLTRFEIDNRCHHFTLKHLHLSFPLSCGVIQCLGVQLEGLQVGYLLFIYRGFVPKHLATSSHAPLVLGKPSFQSPLFVMSFRQQFAKNSVNVHQAWLADIKNQFVQECEKASRSGRCFCDADYGWPAHSKNEREKEFTRKQLQELLMELGFPEGKVKLSTSGTLFRIEVQWSPEDADCKVSPPQTSRGTCTTCPICQEHRPVVVLVPCGHVICQDCHDCKQLCECPMCRAAITSAMKCLEHNDKILSKI